MRGTIELVSALAILLFALLPAQAKVPERLAALRDHSALTRDVFARAEELRLQVLVGEVVVKDGKPALERHGFRVDAEYFYPAGALGLLASIGALQMLEGLREKEPELARTTPLRFHPSFEGESVESSDVTNRDGGVITLEHEIRKLFLAGDDAAFNRVYEFAGADALAACFDDRGYRTVRIFHRLSTARTEALELRTPRVDLVLGERVVTLPERTAKKRAGSKAKGLLVGKSHKLDGALVKKPFDFASKNAVSLLELQDVLVALARPEIDVGRKPLALSDASRAWLVDVACELPSASRNPRYARTEVPDDSAKWIAAGVWKHAGRDRVRVANKVGRASGFSVENAYVEDRGGGRGFFVTVALYTNADGVVHDGAYEYDSIATPFLVDVGEALARLYLLP